MTSVVIVASPQPLLPFVFEAWPQTKRTKLRHSLKYGAILVNGRAVTRHDHSLKVGDRVEIRALREVKAAQVPSLEGGMRMLFHDDSLIVVHKPEGLLSMATDPQSAEPTAYRLLNDWCRDQAHSGRSRVWIVHRLDRETSGVLLMARSEEVKLKLQEQWSEFEKRYVAVVEGGPTAEQGILRDFIDESQVHRVFCHSDGRHGAREAITEFMVLRRGAGRCLLELRLRTGRRHQIRAQLANAGWPVVGDERYGSLVDPLRRIALHAQSLRIQHPVSSQWVQWESPAPESFERLLRS